MTEANQEEFTVSKIKKRLELEVTMPTIKRILNASPEVKCNMEISAQLLTKIQRDERIKQATENLNFADDYWKGMVFQEEKKFNLDGLDGMNFYWNHVGNGETVFSRRHQGGGSLMLWQCFSNHSLKPK